MATKQAAPARKPAAKRDAVTINPDLLEHLLKQAESKVSEEAARQRAAAAAIERRRELDAVASIDDPSARMAALAEREGLPFFGADAPGKFGGADANLQRKIDDANRRNGTKSAREV